MKPIRILLIDDEEDYCLLMKRFFFARNCDVQIAHTLKEGLDFIGTYKPEILFLDNNLPDGKGWSHVDNILSTNPHTQIHLVSAYKPETDNIRSLAKVKVWEKPISLNNLSDILTAHT
jgi:two-component system OmpR family response regulator